MNEKKLNTKRLVESAIFLAIGYILSIIKIKIPFASVTLASMLPIIIMSYKYGYKWGTFVGFIHGILQILEGGLSAPPTKTIFGYILVFLLDYALAWAFVGLFSGLAFNFMKKNKKLDLRIQMAIASIVGLLGRFVCNFTSGILIWSTYAPEGQAVPVYSFLFNGSIILAEMVITVAISLLITSIPEVRRKILEEKN